MIDNLYKSIDKAVIEATRYTKDSGKNLVHTYTSADELEKAAAQRKMAQDIGIAVGVCFVLIAAAAAGAAVDPAIAPVLGGFTDDMIIAIKSATVVGIMVSNTYIGLSGVAFKVARKDVDLSKHLIEHFTDTWNELEHGATEIITESLKNLMTGANDTHGQSLLRVIKSGDFIEPDPYLFSGLKKEIDQLYYAAGVQSMWEFEGAYIVDADANGGSCQSDNRGPYENRVCLSELPGRSFWLYSIDMSKEDDQLHDSQATVKGSHGYRNFFQDQNRYNLTKEDIIRSSIFVHQNNLEDYLENADVQNLVDIYKGKGNQTHGAVPGAFRVPVCRNPGGEAISSVRDKMGKGQNYPCMCGDFSWDKKNWSWDKDETRKFLELTGLEFSEDWEDYCSDHNHCKGDHDILWNSNTTKGDPPIPRKMKHPFSKCKSKDHGYIGHPELDNSAKPTKRS